MDRLTTHNEYDHGALSFVKAADGRAVDMNMILEHLAAYEDTGLTPGDIKSLLAEWRVNLKCLDKYRKAEAEGRLIVLPCKVGDMVHIIVDGKIYTSEVYHITYSDYYGKAIGTVWTHSGVCAYFDHFGKCAFLTREEAEAALKEEEA